MTKPSIDIQAAIDDLHSGKDLSGKGGILTPLIKQLTVAAELGQHLQGNDILNRLH